MRAQMERLVVEAGKKNIVIQVVPFSAGAHPGSQGAFLVMDFPEPDPALVYIETLSGNLFLETPGEVQTYRSNFEQLIALSLSPAESLKLIKTAAKAA